MNRLEHRAREWIIELAARLQFNRQMGEASGSDLELKMISEIATSPIALSSDSRLSVLSHTRFRIILW